MSPVPLPTSQVSWQLTLNLFQSSKASGDKLLLRLKTRSPFPLKKHFYVRLSQLAHPEVGGATDKNTTTNPPPPLRMRKFKQRPVIYPRLCQAPPQAALEPLLPSPFPFQSDGPLQAAEHQLAPSRGFQSHSPLSSLGSPLKPTESAPRVLTRLQ